jgi:hypothetical protein
MPEQIRAWHAGELAAQQARGYEDGAFAGPGVAARRLEHGH